LYISPKPTCFSLMGPYCSYNAAKGASDGSGYRGCSPCRLHTRSPTLKVKSMSVNCYQKTVLFAIMPLAVSQTVKLVSCTKDFHMFCGRKFKTFEILTDYWMNVCNSFTLWSLNPSYSLYKILCGSYGCYAYYDGKY
jgi:hypothetical protein